MQAAREVGAMIDWSVRHTICGLPEVDEHGRKGVTHMVSILDPGEAEPSSYYWEQVPERLTLRFHDAIVPYPQFVLPKRQDLAAILAFARGVPESDPAHLLIHCHMGISRSTAAAAAVLLQARPDTDEDGLFDHLVAVRPKAWPNSLMIGHADFLLGRGGRLTAALGRFYRRQLLANPGFAQPLRTNGRAGELEMAERA
jgi:predicted protein tyrosine phosphatase